MRSGIASVFIVLALSHAHAQEELCDLNKIIKPLAQIGWNTDGTELIEKSISPALIPCTCEIDPFLASIADRDPVADAQSSFESGSPHFVTLPTLGGAVFFQNVDPVTAPDLPSRPISGADEGAECYERERLEHLAQQYAATYNDTLATLVNNR